MNVETAPAFTDTIILLYAVAADDPDRSPVAQDLLRTLMATNALRTSTQVLQELFVNLTRKARRPIAPKRALEYMDQVAAWPVVVTEYADIQKAVSLADTSRLSFWDALIVVSAAKCGARILYTEDLNHGQTISGVRITNPFRR